MFSKILKANPYHDESGKFSTEARAKFVSTGPKFQKPKISLPDMEHARVKTLTNKEVFRASEDGSARKATGSKAALGEGYYFGLTKGDVEGYGSVVGKHKVSGKFVEVDGDAGLKELQQEAGKEAQAVMAQHLTKVSMGSTPNADLLARASSGTAYLPTYLKDRGVSGLLYRHKNKDDHHDQMVVFDETAIQKTTKKEESFVVSGSDPTKALPGKVKKSLDHPY